MYIYHKYQRKIERAGALTKYTQYKNPVIMRKDPDREPRILNPDTPRSEFAVSRTRYTIYHLTLCIRTIIFCLQKQVQILVLP